MHWQGHANPTLSVRAVDATASSSHVWQWVLTDWSTTSLRVAAPPTEEALGSQRGADVLGMPLVTHQREFTGVGIEGGNRAARGHQHANVGGERSEWLRNS
jgi:hypothetical protein